MLECVVNISEGRDPDVLGRLRAAAGDALLDLHADAHHHRSVLTLVGEDAARAVASVAVEHIDLRVHQGAHPRLGVVDVVPFVPLGDHDPDDAVRARDAFAHWFVAACSVPCFLYGSERSLPDVRRRAFRDLAPDVGPGQPHASAGATAVGARPVLVAYNLWLDGDVATARSIAAAVRGPTIRALGLAVGARVQVSMNLVAPEVTGPADAFDLVGAVAVEHGAAVAGAELVGLVPAAVLHRVPAGRWAQLDLAEDRTIEARLAERR